MKMYALALDFSPSEQLSGDPQNVISMGMVVGLFNYDSFERVGSEFQIDEERLELKKWSGSSKK